MEKKVQVATPPAKKPDHEQKVERGEKDVSKNSSFPWLYVRNTTGMGLVLESKLGMFGF